MEILFLFTTWTLASSTTPSSRKTIAINDHVFVGQDPVLTKALAEKTNFTINAPEVKDFDIGLPQFLTVESYLNSSLRRTDYTYLFENDPKEYTLNFKILDMMRQDIYGTQLRLNVLDKKIKKYYINHDFRLAYIFGKLEEWLYDMRVIWAIVRKGREVHEESKLRRFRFYKHLLYYTHMLRRDFDITYTVEDLIRIHNNIFKKTTEGLPTFRP